MAKTDFKTDRKDLYAPPAGRFVEVTVPAMTFVAIDGHGDPNTSDEYRHAVEALFAVSFAVHQQARTRPGLRRRPSRGAVVSGRPCCLRAPREEQVVLDGNDQAAGLAVTHHDRPGASLC